MRKASLQVNTSWRHCTKVDEGNRVTGQGIGSGGMDPAGGFWELKFWDNGADATIVFFT